MRRYCPGASTIRVGAGVRAGSSDCRVPQATLGAGSATRSGTAVTSAAVEHVPFGRTGLRVSRLCLGTMTFGFQCDEDTSVAILDAADEAGITFLDSADAY